MNMRYKVKYQQMLSNRLMLLYNSLVRKLLSLRLEVCSHEIVCVKDSVAPVAAAEEGIAKTCCGWALK